ncbi:MAG: DUF1295 domain-containing protein [Betaproteobacteria bacterium]
MNEPLIAIPMVCLLWLLLQYRKSGQGLSLRTAIYPLIPVLWLILSTQWGAFDPALRQAMERQTLMGAAVWVLVSLVWALGTVMRNHSIMDIAYPLTPWAVTCLAWWQWGANPSLHVLILLVCMTIWSWRLGGYIAMRYLPHGEEARYARWRERGGASWWWWSYFQIYLTQGVLIWMWTWPLALALGAGAQASVLTVLAVASWMVGFVFEAGGDLQMHRFRSNPANKGKVMDQGLWAWCRHPNYFGESMTWFAFGLFALAAPWGWLGLPMVAMVFWFMNQGSALSMTERYMLKTKPGYAEYMARTPAFFPKPPRGSP